MDARKGFSSFIEIWDNQVEWIFNLDCPSPRKTTFVFNSRQWIEFTINIVKPKGETMRKKGYSSRFANFPRTWMKLYTLSLFVFKYAASLIELNTLRLPVLYGEEGAWNNLDKMLLSVHQRKQVKRSIKVLHWQ